MKKILAALLSVALVLSTLSGCSDKGNLELRMDIDGGVVSLDPQFATDTSGRTIIANSFEGLLCKDSSGKLVPGVAERYELSEDGLSYTFFLRSDAKWSDGGTVTAEDFVFALRRLFHPQVPSPYAEEFLAIHNAPEVLSGALKQDALGVRAKDNYTLEITLSEPSPLFLEKLTSTAAMPCNEDFFTGTRARYGLNTEYLKFNGAYKVTNWDNDKYIVLKPNANYHTRQELPFPALYLYTVRQTETKTALELFNEGKSDIYLATAEELEGITVRDATYLEIKNRVWQLLFNTSFAGLENENIRRGLAMSLDSNGYTARIPEMYGQADSLIPRNARPQAMKLPRLLPFDRVQAQAAMEQGMSEAEMDKLPPMTLLLPQDVQLDAVASYLQKQWMDAHGIVVNLEPPMTTGEYNKKLQSKSFSLALVPKDASGQDCADVLNSYTATNVQNYGGFASAEYDKLLVQAAGAGSEAQSLGYYLRAEQLLIDKVAAVPLFTQSGYYAFGKGVTGVSLVGGLLSFRGARRNG